MQYVKDEAFLIDLGKRIRELREAKNLTQLELAVLCGNHAEQIGRIERGKSNVTICTLKKIAEALEVKISDLTD